MKTIVDPRLKHVEARAWPIRLLIANAAARELIKVLARIHPLLHERHHLLRRFLAGFRVAQTLRAIPLPDAGFVLEWKFFFSCFYNASYLPFFSFFFSFFFLIVPSLDRSEKQFELVSRIASKIRRHYEDNFPYSETVNEDTGND